jgi:hypothetical protein
VVTAVLSTAVTIAIVGFLVVRDPEPRVTRAGALSVPTSRTAPAALAPSTITPAAPLVPPTGVSIPTLGLDAAIDAVGVEPGTNEIAVPPLDRVGWYRFGAVPGASGSSVLLGHVDGDGREGVFFRLGALAPGDPLQLRFADGSERSFHVVGRDQFPKSALPPELFSRAGPSRLVLITCGGSFDPSSRHYRDNVVVVAEPDAS